MDVEIRTSRINGQGCYATRAYRKGEIIGEYTGEIVSEEEADARYAERDKTYLFDVGDGDYIDGDVGDNPLRFVNHSCEPNCESEQDGKRIRIRALRRIRAGEELTYDYHLIVEEDDDDPYTCLCGAARCRRTMKAAA